MQALLPTGALALAALAAAARRHARLDGGQNPEPTPAPLHGARLRRPGGGRRWLTRPPSRPRRPWQRPRPRRRRPRRRPTRRRPAPGRQRPPCRLLPPRRRSRRPPGPRGTLRAARPPRGGRFRGCCKGLLACHAEPGCMHGEHSGTLEPDIRQAALPLGVKRYRGQCPYSSSSSFGAHVCSWCQCARRRPAVALVAAAAPPPPQPPQPPPPPALAAADAAAGVTGAPETAVAVAVAVLVATAVGAAHPVRRRLPQLTG